MIGKKRGKVKMSDEMNLTVVLDKNLFFISEGNQLCCRKCLKSSYYLRADLIHTNILHVMCGYCGHDVELKVEMKNDG